MNYTGFISYSSKSGTLAQRLHRELENYSIPRTLRGVCTANGSIGKTAGKFFVDRAELSASVRLKGDIEKALRNSRFLIVLCSPEAAQSPWVNKEIAYFRGLGRGKNIVPILASGTPCLHHPDTAPDGAFPAALFALGEAEPEMPHAPDFRDPAQAPDSRAEGFETGFLRVLARILGVRYPDLTQRHLVAEREKRRLRNQVIGVLAVLLVLAVGGGWTAWVQKQAADQRLAQAIGSAARQVQLASGFRDRYGVPAAVAKDLFSGAADDFAAIVSDAGNNPDLLLQRAKFSLGMAELSADIEGSDESTASFIAKAREDLAMARAMKDRWFAGVWYHMRPAEEEILREEISALDISARAASRAAVSAQAKEMARKAQALSEKLHAAHSDPTRVSADAVFSQCALSDIHYQLGERLLAQDMYEKCLEAAEQLWQRDDADAHRTMLVRSLIDYGMIVRLDPTRIDEARDLHARAAQMATAVGGGDLVSNDKQLLAAEARVSLADTMSMAGADPNLQMDAYAEAHDILTGLVQSDPARKDWKLLDATVLYRLAGVRARVAAAAQSPEDLAQSASELDHGLSLLDQLVRRFPEDVSLARTLSALLETRAEVSTLRQTYASNLAASELEAAARRDLRQLVTRRIDLSAQHPDQLVLRRDVANAYLTRARLRSQLGDPLDHVAADFDLARAGFEALADQPDMQPWSGRDLALVDYSHARLLAAQGDRLAACARAQASQTRMTGLAAEYPQAARLGEDARETMTLVAQLCEKARDKKGDD